MTKRTLSDVIKEESEEIQALSDAIEKERHKKTQDKEIRLSEPGIQHLLEDIPTEFLSVKMNKPPFGVRPRNFFEDERINDLARAIHENVKYSMEYPEEILSWVEELRTRLEWMIKNNKNS